MTARAIATLDEAAEALDRAGAITLFPNAAELPCLTAQYAEGTGGWGWAGTIW